MAGMEYVSTQGFGDKELSFVEYEARLSGKVRVALYNSLSPFRILTKGGFKAFEEGRIVDSKGASAN